MSTYEQKKSQRRSKRQKPVNWPIPFEAIERVNLKHRHYNPEQLTKGEVLGELVMKNHEQIMAAYDLVEFWRERCESEQRTSEALADQVNDLQRQVETLKEALRTSNQLEESEDYV